MQSRKKRTVRNFFLFQLHILFKRKKEKETETKIVCVIGMVNPYSWQKSIVCVVCVVHVIESSNQ